MAEQGDMNAHEATYSGFIGWAKWGTAVALLTTLIVVLIIA